MAIYHVLNDGVAYRAPDGGEIREREYQHLIAHHWRCLQRLGVFVPDAKWTTLASSAQKKTRGAAATVETRRKTVEMVPPAAGLCGN